MAPAVETSHGLNFPEHFPAERKVAVLKTYEDALEQAKVDNPEGFHRQAATREATRHFRVPALKSHADAMRLERWQYLQRDEVSAEKVASMGYETQGPGVHLRVVTIDGKKYFFGIPGGNRAEAQDVDDSALDSSAANSADEKAARKAAREAAKTK